jgi:general secretion pathway protein M
MMARLTLAQRRLLALGVLALVVTLSVGLVVGPVVAQHRYYDGRIAELREQLERLTAMARTRTRSEQALKYMKQHGPVQRYYLQSRSESLASAELQQHAKRAIERNSGQVVSTQVLASQRFGNAAVATLRVSMRGDIKALQRVLHELETGRPILFLDQISIVGYGANVAQARMAREPELTIRFDMSGYLREKETG